MIITSEKIVKEIRIVDININKHVIVGFTPSGRSYLITRENFESGRFIALALDAKVSNGNRYAPSSKNHTLFEFLESLLANSMVLAAFYTWQDAFQWLLEQDNS